MDPLMIIAPVIKHAADKAADAFSKLPLEFDFTVEREADINESWTGDDDVFVLTIKFIDKRDFFVKRIEVDGFSITEKIADHSIGSIGGLGNLEGVSVPSPMDWKPYLDVAVIRSSSTFNRERPVTREYLIRPLTDTDRIRVTVRPEPPLFAVTRQRYAFIRAIVKHDDPL